MRFLAAVLFLVAVFRPLAAGDPNIFIIVADDLGYRDVGFNGGTEIPTPHLDRLAAQSIRCTSGYVSHPFCSPTRAGLLTGRYQQRFGHENNPAYLPDDPVAGLPVEQITIADRLKKLGYVTGAVGKWHLGAHPQFHPNRRGFDEFFGFIGGGHIYLPGGKGGEEYNLPLQFNGEPRPFGGYLTPILGREAATFVARHVSEKWLLYLAFNAPHTPLVATDELLEKFASIADENRRIYAAMVHSMDAAIGEVLAKLDSTGQRDNTLIFFVSDNGGPDLTSRGLGNFTDNSPLRGAKGQVFEGGIRVPFLVSWPAKLKPGNYDRPVISLDFLPTAIAAAGGEPGTEAKIDGVNLLPFLTGENRDPPHQTLFWRSGGPGGSYAARSGPWKHVKLGQQPAELYNLDTDIAESKNLAATNPKKLAELRAAVMKWDRQNIAPVFDNPKPAQKKTTKAKTAKPGPKAERRPGRLE